MSIDVFQVGHVRTNIDQSMPLTDSYRAVEDREKRSLLFLDVFDLKSNINKWNSIFPLHESCVFWFASFRSG